MNFNNIGDEIAMSMRRVIQTEWENGPTDCRCMG
jgi:hypothetical protein